MGPSWVSNAVVYQIFPDRFQRSGKVKLQADLQLMPWGANPAEQGFQGGDLYGIIESLDRLQAIGITCLYLTPIFTSAANHRYHTFDYFQVDPLLGGDTALTALISALHTRGMRIILDGVFNHCSRGFWAFHHVVENGPASPYRGWFHIVSWPLQPYPAVNEFCGYHCWWNNPALPKFNHEHPSVQELLLNVGRHWLQSGIDGWRLDVPDEVPASFWLKFRQMVKEVNAEAWIVGEIWGDAQPWLAGNHFDGVMNYRLGWSILSWVGGNCLMENCSNPQYPLQTITTPELITIWQQIFGNYAPEVNCCQLNLLDSHDVPRALHTLVGKVSALKLALTLLFLHPGAPCIYYGTEACLDGGAEPGCREAFPCGRPWSGNLSEVLRSLADLRKKHPSLSTIEPYWQALGKHGLVGVWPMAGLTVWLNRSRENTLPIPSDQGKVIWRLITGDSNSVSPQGAVLCESSSLC